MEKIKNTREQMEHELIKVFTDTILGYSSLGEKGRFINGITLSHILHKVIPEEVHKIVSSHIIIQKED